MTSIIITIIILAVSIAWLRRRINHYEEILRDSEEEK